MLGTEKIEDIKAKVFEKRTETNFDIVDYYYKIYKGKKRNTPNLRLIVNTKFGLCDMAYQKAIRGQNPSIMSAVDKKDYVDKMIKHYHPKSEGLFVKDIYGKNRKNIVIVEKEGFSFELIVNQIYKTLHFSIENVIEKDEYIRYLLYRDNKYFQNSDIKLKETFNFKRTNEKILVETKYGDCETFLSSLLFGRGVNITSAINKTEYFKNMLYDRYPEYFDTYDLSLVNYKSHNTPIKIICKKHGIFELSPNSVFTSKTGCKKCGNILTAEFGRNNPVGWGYTAWQKAAERSKKFDSFKVYILRCWNDEEEFYKIGKTFTKIKLRFRTSFKSKIPYDYEIIKVFESKTDGLYISKLEKELQKLNKDNKYLPKTEFAGMYECFKTVNYEL